MIDIFKHTLMKKNPESLIRFELLEQLLIYVSFHNDFHISNSYLLKILNFYLNDQHYNPHNCNRIDKIYLLCEKIIDIYKANHSSKFNFIIKESNIDSDIQKWLLTSKENIFNLCSYYLINNNYNYQKIIFFNHFFRITYIEHDSSKRVTLPYCHTSGISIRILLSGKILYNFHQSKILLNQGEALISSANTPLENCTLYSPSVKIIIIHLNYDFIKNFNLNSKNEFIKKFYFSNKISDFEKLLNQDFILKNPLFIYELLGSLLKEGELIITPLISDKIDVVISTLFLHIEGNIRLSTENIITTLETSFSLPKAKLDELVYLNFKTTLAKLIIKIKIDIIINHFFKSSDTIEVLIGNYNMKSINSFKYFLNIFYNINLKTLEQIKKERNYNK